MGFLTRDDRALVIDCPTPRVDVALRDSVTLFPSVHVPSRMKKPRTRRGQSIVRFAGDARSECHRTMLSRASSLVYGRALRSSSPLLLAKALQQVEGMRASRRHCSASASL